MPDIGRAMATQANQKYEGEPVQDIPIKGLVGGQSRQSKSVFIKCEGCGYTSDFYFGDSYSLNRSRAAAVFSAGRFAQYHDANADKSRWHKTELFERVERSTTTITEEKIV